jgi:hypothetical protein
VPARSPRSTAGIREALATSLRRYVAAYTRPGLPAEATAESRRTLAALEAGHEVEIAGWRLASVLFDAGLPDEAARVRDLPAVTVAPDGTYAPAESA